MLSKNCICDIRLYDTHLFDHFTEKLKKCINKDTIIVCLGTDATIIDSYAPMVGTILKERGFKFPVFGTLNKPIHMLNINSSFDVIFDKYDKNNVLTVTTIFGDAEDYKKILLYNKGMKPGKATGKDMPSVGNTTVACCFGDKHIRYLMNQPKLRINSIYKRAKVTADLIINAFSGLNDDKNIK